MDTARAPEQVTRWMWSGPKANVVPGACTTRRSGPPSRRTCSSSDPSTTCTAPLERSWSCQPVSFSGSQAIAHSSSSGSRWSDA